MGAPDSQARARSVSESATGDVSFDAQGYDAKEYGPVASLGAPISIATTIVH